MKPFNLEQAKAGKKVITRKGRPVRIVDFNNGVISFPIIAMVKKLNGEEEEKTYSTTGTYYQSGTKNSFDLFMADEEPESEVTDLQKWCKEILPIVQAGANGEEIEIFNQVEWDNKVSLIFNSAFKYRIKPKVKVVNGFEVPMHETAPPDMGQQYYTPAPHEKEYHFAFRYYGDEGDLELLTRGLVYLNKESAIKCAKAMLGINPEEE